MVKMVKDRKEIAMKSATIIDTDGNTYFVSSGRCLFKETHIIKPVQGEKDIVSTEIKQTFKLFPALGYGFKPAKT